MDLNASDGVQIGVGVVLTLTLGAVLWYGWQTRRQAEATIKMAETAEAQTKVAAEGIEEMRRSRLEQSRPEIAIELTGQAPDKELCKGVPKQVSVQIANSGLGVATNVYSELLWADWLFTAEPSSLPYLDIREVQSITFRRERPSYEGISRVPMVKVSYGAATGVSFWTTTLELEVLNDGGEVKAVQSRTTYKLG